MACLARCRDGERCKLEQKREIILRRLAHRKSRGKRELVYYEVENVVKYTRAQLFDYHLRHQTRYRCPSLCPCGRHGTREAALGVSVIFNRDEWEGGVGAGREETDGEKR